MSHTSKNIKYFRYPWRDICLVGIDFATVGIWGARFYNCKIVIVKRGPGNVEKTVDI